MSRLRAWWRRWRDDGLEEELRAARADALRAQRESREAIREAAQRLEALGVEVGDLNEALFGRPPWWERRTREGRQ